ncbi:transcriptional regulator,LexA repressor,LexA repressor,repressor LexA,Helix-turn-helix [[Clostridium] sordellii]|uniref:helix-turn-helix domain-containing protein n=1 Tax=Paraclostridium sordellii TaxID=1505 RepID=UPI000541FD4D|nr:helix-turn-helix domain-containing protein [Paeniclostridium sordellii]CEK36493.1 transcriptional regulator,LexA repressor,LexA repressor,repressor LexA,Helix-turn-helix [[Clostridium] sordellii] [Paeniclostridium sordellii]
MLKSKFPYNLKELRESMGLSQTELSKKIDVSRATLSNYESGQSEPVLCNLIKLAEFFNCSIDELVFGCNSQKNLNSISYNTYSIQLSNILDQLERINLDKIISNVKLIKNDFDNNSLQNSVSKSNTKIDFAENISYKSEIAEETSPVISIDDYNRNSIDVDFYNENNIFIVDASPFSSDETEKVYSYGNISAGIPVFGEDSIEDEFNIFKYDLKYDADHYFVLKVKGESMNRLYKNGDYLLVEKSCYCSYNLNKPVIVFLENEATVKFVEIDKYSLTTIPYSTESKFKPITYSLKDYNYHIAGNVVGVINIIKDN